MFIHLLHNFAYIIAYIILTCVDFIKSVCDIYLLSPQDFYFTIRARSFLRFRTKVQNFCFIINIFVFYTLKTIQILFPTQIALKDYRYYNITYRLFAMISISVRRVRKQTVIMAKINRIFG